MPAAPDLSHIVEDLRPLAVPIASIHPDPENARLHPSMNVATIKESIRRKGQDQPLVVRAEDMMLSKGHGRLQAMVELGYTHVAVVTVNESRLSAIERGLVDNRSSDLSENDDIALAKLLEYVTIEGGEIIGWNDEEMAEILLACDEIEKTTYTAGEEEANTQESDAPSLPGVVYRADIIFDNPEQQGQWHAFVRRLRKMYPELATIGSRVNQFLEDYASE